MNQVLAILEEEEDAFVSADVCLQPPADGRVSDGDTDDEDDPVLDASHFSKAQLLAEADFRIRYPNKTVDSSEMNEVDEHENIEGTSVSTQCTDLHEPSTSAAMTTESQNATKRPMSTCQPPSLNLKWKQKDMKQTHIEPLNHNKLDFEFTPLSLFNLFFDDEIISFLVEMTTLYAKRDRGHVDFETSADEIRLFLAILLLTGYNSLPRRRLYWENSDDVHCEAVTKAFSRNRFDLLVSCLHCSDNMKLQQGDKMAKIRPLYDLLNERCKTYAPNVNDKSIDEAMIPYYGRNNSKQRMQNKPVRVGYKLWVLAESSGYVIQFDPYCGAKAGNSCHASPTSWGLAEKVVLSLCEALPNDKAQHLYMDNYFTSFRLLDYLAGHNIKATGTIRANKIRQCDIIDPKQLEKEERGYYQQRTACAENGHVTCVGWNDNRPVYVASNADGIKPLTKVSRWSASENKRIMVPQPNVIHLYNKSMGGVDRCDQNVSKYRISIRSKKWWWPLFAWPIDMAVQNSWILYRLWKDGDQPNMDLLSFRRCIVQTLLSKFDTRRSCSGRPRGRILAGHKRVHADIRYDHVDHYQTLSKTQKRCAFCGKNTRKLCNKCDVGLHDHCFVDWHKY